MKLHFRSLLAAVAGAVLLLSGCTITYVVPEQGATIRFRTSNDVIERFGVFADQEVFREGDLIAFVIRTNQSGFVTLTSLLPDGEVRVVAQNLPVTAGVTTVLDGTSIGSRFIVGPPEGVHRIRATFTTGVVAQQTTLFQGRFGEADWTAALRVFIEPYTVWDVYETQFFVR